MKNCKQAIILGFIGLFAVGYAVYPTKNTQEEVFKKVREQVVMLTDTAGLKGGGTGFAIQTNTGHKYVLTNAHICALTTEGGSLRATSASGAEYFLQVVAVARKDDLCLLSAAPGLNGLVLATSLEEGQTIYVVGHPHLLPNTPSTGLFTYRDFVQVADPEADTQEACDQADGIMRPIQTLFGEIMICVQTRDAGFTNAPTYPGNSGSPVTNGSGDVVGVIFAVNGVLGYFVPRGRVEDFLNKY